MKWQPWYTYAIIATITVIVKGLQQNSTKKFKIKKNEIAKNTIGDSDINEDNENKYDTLFEGSVYNLISELIKELGYVLISKNIDSNDNYEITFMNYEKKIFDFKRESTYIKITGNDKLKDISYTTWSDRYEIGQNSHNEEIAQEFFNKMTEKFK
jgi:hypothetical protein